MSANVNLSDLLFGHPFGDGQALLHTVEHTVTAGAARAAADATARQLGSAGIGPGSAVAVCVANGPTAITTMMGVWRQGAVFIPVNPRAPAAELERITAMLGPAGVITDDGLEVRPEHADYEPGIAFVLWTSGTTGAPKPILHTHDAYLEILDRVLTQLRPGTRSSPGPVAPNLIPVSLALNAGLYNSLFGLRAGAALVLMDRFEPGTFAQLISRFSIRSTVLPPAAITMLNDSSEVSDLSPLRYVRSITAPLSPREARRFAERFGVFVLNGYGQAEIGEVIGWTAADAREHPEKLGAVGRPHPGVDLRVDADGRLWVRPPSMAVSYAGGDDLGERVDAEGFVDTGDLARIDEDGFVWIEGRLGDVINRGGNKVHPGEVEEVLRRAPGVTEVVVVGVPDRRLGQVPVAVYEGRPAPEKLLSDLCRTDLAAYKIPVSFHWRDTLPRNETGKVLRSQVAEEVTASLASDRATTGQEDTRVSTEPEGGPR